MTGDASEDKKVIILLEDVDRLALKALIYSKQISKNITAFSATTKKYEEEELRAKWDMINSGIPYIILCSQYKDTAALLSEYIDSTKSERSEEIIVLVPLVTMKGFIRSYINQNYIKQLKRGFTHKNNIVFVFLHYYLEQNA